MRIDLEHISHPETLEWSTQWWNMFFVLGRHDRLGKWCLKHPTLCYECFIECGKNTFQRRKIFSHHFLLAHREEWIVHRSITTKIEKMSSSIFSWQAEISMLEQASKRITSITNINPVAISQLFAHTYNEAVSSICLTPIILGAVTFRQCWNQAAGK